MRSQFPLCARHQGNFLAIQPCLANQQARRHRHAYPSIFQNVDGESGASRRQLTEHAQIVIHAGQGGVKRRRFLFVVRWIGLGPKHPVLLDGNDDPSRGVGGFHWLFLSSGRRARKKANGGKAGKRKSQKQSAWGDYGAQRLFHDAIPPVQPFGSTRTATTLAMRLVLRGMYVRRFFQGKNAASEENCSKSVGGSSLVTSGTGVCKRAQRK